MIKVRNAFFVSVLVLTLLLLLPGCGILSSRTAEPAVEMSGDELPQWLLLAHRADDKPFLPAVDSNDEDEENGEEDPAVAAGSPAVAKTNTEDEKDPFEDFMKNISGRANSHLRDVYAEEVKQQEAVDAAFKKWAAEQNENDPDRGWGESPNWLIGN